MLPLCSSLTVFSVDLFYPKSTGMAAAMAYCTSNTAFYQHSLNKTRPPLTPASRRTTSSPSASFTSTASFSHIEQTSIVETIKSDENNNSQQIENPIIGSINQVLYITSDDDDINNSDYKNQTGNDIDEEAFLALVGLRPKAKRSIARHLNLRPLTKRLACPVCLLPLPKYIERVRQALSVRLPFLKFLTITYDTESFCSTDNNAKVQSLLPRSIAQAKARTLLKMNRSPSKKKLSKAGKYKTNKYFITMKI